MAGILEMMAMEQKQQEERASYAEKNELIFKVDQNSGSSRVRFLTDFHNGIGMPWHKNFDLKNRANHYEGPCLSEFEDGCAWCYHDVKKLARNAPTYAFLVYDYGTDKVRVLHGRNHEKTIVGKLYLYYQKKKSILGRDFYVDKSGEGMATVYSVTPEDASPFEFADKFPGIASPDFVKQIQESIKRTLVLTHAADLAERMGYGDADKVSSLWSGGSSAPKRPTENPATRRPSGNASTAGISFGDD